MRYCVKNCPVFNAKHEICNKKSKVIYCKNITDCLLKQIVEKCKSRSENSFDNSFLFAEDLLELLEIEEVDE